MAKAATQKIDYYSKRRKGRTFSVHQVLADLCMLLVESFIPGSDVHEERSDAQVFQAMLCYSNVEGFPVPEIFEDEYRADTVNNIYFINYEHANVREDEFLGACIDSAAQETVVGEPQAELYINRCGKSFKLEASNIVLASDLELIVIQDLVGLKS